MSNTPYQYIERTYCMTFYPGDIVSREEQGQRLATVIKPDKSNEHYVNVILPETGRASLFHPGSLQLVESRTVNGRAKP